MGADVTTYLDEILDPAELRTEIQGGYVTEKRHPTEPLSIFNYTPAAQYERRWNRTTRTCRGLIVDDAGAVIARPFAKFFNHGEMPNEHPPTGDPQVFDKLDGSLGIIYPLEAGGYAVATRGSFTSDQALWATAFLNERMPTFDQPADCTTLVEILYPANRIVVDYRDRESLVCLGAVRIASGQDVQPDWWWGDKAQCWGKEDIDKAVARGTHDTYAEGEGVVLVWPNIGSPAYRLKVKHPNYIRLHRIVTGLSTRSIWEALKEGTYYQLISEVPEEFLPWVEQVGDQLLTAYTDILTEARIELTWARGRAIQIADGEPTRAILASVIKDTRHPGLCFALLDGKDIAEKVWRMVKPERTTAAILDAEAAA